MSWRLAKSLEKLREQVDAMAPRRSKISDGSIGDTAHSNRTSDHNPWCGPGVVTAIDITHDPDDGADMVKVTEALRLSKDPRIKYVIFQGRMFSSYATSSHAAWTWRPYSGVNAHAQHAHISVQCNASKDSTRAWSIERKEWFEMATKADLRQVVRGEIKKSENRIRAEIKNSQKELAVGKTQKAYKPDNVNLKKLQKQHSTKEA